MALVAVVPDEGLRGELEAAAAALAARQGAPLPLELAASLPEGGIVCLVARGRDPADAARALVAPPPDAVVVLLVDVVGPNPPNMARSPLQVPASLGGVGALVGVLVGLGAWAGQGPAWLERVYRPEDIGVADRRFLVDVRVWEHAPAAEHLADLLDHLADGLGRAGVAKAPDAWCSQVDGLVQDVARLAAAGVSAGVLDVGLARWGTLAVAKLDTLATDVAPSGAAVVSAATAAARRVPRAVVVGPAAVLRGKVADWFRALRDEAANGRLDAASVAAVLGELQTAAEEQVQSTSLAGAIGEEARKTAASWEEAERTWVRDALLVPTRAATAMQAATLGATFGALVFLLPLSGSLLAPLGGALSATRLPPALLAAALAGAGTSLVHTAWRRAHLDRAAVILEGMRGDIARLDAKVVAARAAALRRLLGTALQDARAQAGGLLDALDVARRGFRDHTVQAARRAAQGRRDAWLAWLAATPCWTRVPDADRGDPSRLAAGLRTAWERKLLGSLVQTPVDPQALLVSTQSGWLAEALGDVLATLAPAPVPDGPAEAHRYGLSVDLRGARLGTPPAAELPPGVRVRLGVLRQDGAGS